MAASNARLDLLVNDVAPSNVFDTFYQGGSGWFIVRSGTWGGGNVRLQYRFDLVGSTTWVDVTTGLTADGLVSFSGPPGYYRALVATATGVTAQVLSIILIP